MLSFRGRGETITAHHLRQPTRDKLSKNRLRHHRMPHPGSPIRSNSF